MFAVPGFERAGNVHDVMDDVIDDVIDDVLDVIR